MVQARISWNSHCSAGQLQTLGTTSTPQSLGHRYAPLYLDAPLSFQNCTAMRFDIQIYKTIRFRGRTPKTTRTRNLGDRPGFIVYTCLRYISLLLRPLFSIFGGPNTCRVSSHLIEQLWRISTLTQEGHLLTEISLRLPVRSRMLQTRMEKKVKFRSIKP